MIWLFKKKKIVKLIKFINHIFNSITRIEVEEDEIENNVTDENTVTSSVDKGNDLTLFVETYIPSLNSF